MESAPKSQALLEERALLACMAYVDLNPIRVAIAKTPEASNYTSIKERIEDSESTILMPFSENREAEGSLPFHYRDYLELVDWSGRDPPGADEIGASRRSYCDAHTVARLVAWGIMLSAPVQATAQTDTAYDAQSDLAFLRARMVEIQRESETKLELLRQQTDHHVPGTGPVLNIQGVT